MYKTKLTISEVEPGDTVSLSIKPSKGEPAPSHPFLNIQKGNDGRYNVFFIPWKPGTENDVEGGANFRYGYQVVDRWDDVEVIGINKPEYNGDNDDGGGLNG